MEYLITLSNEINSIVRRFYYSSNVNMCYNEYIIFSAWFCNIRKNVLLRFSICQEIDSTIKLIKRKYLYIENISNIWVIKGKFII